MAGTAAPAWPSGGWEHGQSCWQGSQAQRGTRRLLAILCHGFPTGEGKVDEEKRERKRETHTHTRARAHTRLSKTTQVYCVPMISLP